MPEERRCDLCEHEKDLPCCPSGCNSVNNLKDFKPKGEEKEDIVPTLFVSYQFYAAYESGEMHKDFGNIFLDVAAPTDEYSLCKLEKMISKNIKIRIGFKTSVVTVLNFKNLQ